VIADTHTHTHIQNHPQTDAGELFTPATVVGVTKSRCCMLCGSLSHEGDRLGEDISGRRRQTALSVSGGEVTRRHNTACMVQWTVVSCAAVTVEMFCYVAIYCVGFSSCAHFRTVTIRRLMLMLVTDITVMYWEHGLWKWRVYFPCLRVLCFGYFFLNAAEDLARQLELNCLCVWLLATPTLSVGVGRMFDSVCPSLSFVCLSAA